MESHKIPWFQSPPTSYSPIKMAIELVDLPIKLKIVIFHNYVSLPGRVNPMKSHKPPNLPS